MAATRRIFFAISFLATALNCLAWPVLAGPESTTYELKEYGFGAGGSEGADSSNYSLFGVAGEIDLGNLDSSNYKLKAGLTETIQSNIPAAPTFTNPSSYYNRLNIDINNGSNPTDSTFVIQVATSSDFTTGVNYVQADHTLGSSLVWQTYSSWDGGTGFDIIGLSPNTTYYARVAARQGNFTQSPYSTSATAATSQVSLSFDIDVSSSDTETAPPYSIDMGDLTPGSVTTAANKVWVDLSTNAESGGWVYIYDQYAGLRSTNTSYTINSSSANLATTSEGYGLRSNSASQSSGGPLVAQSPYDGASDNVGVVNTTIRELFSSSSSPITAGRGSVLVKAKTSSTTPASSDYTDTLTLISAASF